MACELRVQSWPTVLILITLHVFALLQPTHFVLEFCRPGSTAREVSVKMAQDGWIVGRKCAETKREYYVLIDEKTAPTLHDLKCAFDTYLTLCETLRECTLMIRDHSKLMSECPPHFSKKIDPAHRRTFFAPKKCPLAINVHPINVRRFHPNYTVNGEFRMEILTLSGSVSGGN